MTIKSNQFQRSDKRMLKDAEEGKGKPKSSKTSNSTEFSISDIQVCGKYVAYLTLVYFFMVLSQVCNLLFMTFADRKSKVEDVCAKKYSDYISTKTCNVTNCWIMTNQSVNVVCSTRTYDFVPISYDFDVPIEYIKLGTTIQNIGLMIGAIVAGNLADIFGRKKILLSFTVGLIIFLVATPFSPSFIVFTILRFFDMIFTGGKHCVCNPYFMENLPDKHRMWVATVVTYSPNYIVLAGIAYMCKKWKILAWTAAAITVLPLIMIPFLVDTPRWLIKKGKGEKASKAAIYIRKWDEKLTPERKERIITAVQEAAKEEACDKIEDGFLIFDWKLGSYAIVFATSLFSTSFISYGIAYNMDALAGTVYINVIILGAARWAINILAAGLEFSIRSVGRRLLHLIAVGFIAIIMGIIFIIYIFTCEELIHAIITFTRYASLLAAAMCTELFVLDAVQPTELFPTPVRSAGIAFIQTFNRLGTIVSPLVFIPSKHWPPAPFLLMFLTSTADFLLYFFLVPETRGKKLPDNMPDEAQTPRENHTQNTESMKNVKMKGDNADSFSPSRQDKRNAKDNEERRKRNKKDETNDNNKGNEKESNNDEKKNEETGKKESEEDRKKMRENEERGAEQKSNEGQSSKTESRESEERKDK
ncbi:Solute carrier family 22 member 6-A [Dirofilaria immitis]